MVNKYLIKVYLNLFLIFLFAFSLNYKNFNFVKNLAGKDSNKNKKNLSNVKNIEITSEDKKIKQTRQQKDKKKQGKNKEIEEESVEQDDPNLLEDHEEKEALEDINLKFQNCLKYSEK